MKLPVIMVCRGFSSASRLLSNVTSQAICTVSDLMSQREWGELRGLLTQKAIDKLRSTKWTFDQVRDFK